MTLTLVRGLPGSGKSTYAKTLNTLHVEADMYHMHDGKYSFDGSRARMAHEWCQRTVLMALEYGMDVVVSNTFTERWEIEPYLRLAARFRAHVRIVRMTGTYGTVHSVPEVTMARMRDRFEAIEGEEIM